MIQENQYHMTYVCGLSFCKATRVDAALYFRMIGRYSPRSVNSTKLVHIVGIIQVVNISVS